MADQYTSEQKMKAISVKYGTPPGMEDMVDDTNRYDRTKQAQEYHDPVNAELRDYQERVKQWDAEDAAGKAAEGQQQSAPQKSQIKEGENIYEVEQHPDGYYITSMQQGHSSPRMFDEPILYGKEMPQSQEEKSLFQQIDEVAGKFNKGIEGAAEGAVRGVAQGLTDLTTNALSVFIDNPLGRQYIKPDDIEAFNTFRDWIQNEVRTKNEAALDDTTAGQVTSFTGEIGSQFVAPAMKGYQFLKGMGASPLVASAIADVGVAVLGVNPNDPNLANLISEDNKTLAPMRDLLATNPDDGDWANRARNATEAMVTLGLGETVAKGLVEGVGRMNKWVKDNNIPKRVLDKLDQYIQDESGQITISQARKLNTSGLVAGAAGAAMAMQPDQAEASTGSRILQRAIKLIGEGAQEGVPVITDDVVKQMRQAAETTGNAFEGLDFNMAHIENPEDIGNLIDKVSEIYADPITKGKRGVQTFDETQAKADLTRSMGFDVEAILQRRKGEAWNAEKLKAARDIFVQQSDITTQMAKAIKEPGGESPEALLAFRRQLAVMAGVQMQIKGAQTEAARALSQFRMTAKTPLESKILVHDIIEQAGGFNANKDMVDAYLNAVQNGGEDAAAIFSRQATRIKGKDMLYEAWINSLLGKPTTHMINISGNLTSTAMSIAERYMAAGYGSLERGVARALGKTPDRNGVFIQEANAYASGMANATLEALRAFGKSFKTGVDSADIADLRKLDFEPSISTGAINELPTSQKIAGLMGKDALIDPQSPLANFVDYAGEYYYRMPGRLLMAEDQFFKTLLYRADLNARASREASAIGLNAEQAAARKAEIFADPQIAAPDIHIGSSEHALEYTYQSAPGEIAGAVNRARNAVPGGKVVIPFFNTINNISKFAVSRTPLVGLGAVNERLQGKVWKDLTSKDPALRQMAVGKISTGSMIAGTTAYLVTEGVVTGRLTDNKKLKGMMMDQGKMPYSVKLMIDGTTKSYQYNRLEPVGMVMGIAATTSEIMSYIDDPEERSNVALAAVSAIMPYMEEKSFFQGITQVMDAINPKYADDSGRVKALERYLVGLAATAPGAVAGPLAPGTSASRWVRYLFDDKIRVTKSDPYRVVKDAFGDEILVPNDDAQYRMWETTIKKIMNATPGLSYNLPPETNMFSETITKDQGAFNPIASDKLAYDDKKLQELDLPDGLKNGYFKGHTFPDDFVPSTMRDLDPKDQAIAAKKMLEKFISIVGIKGEMERLGVPVSMPQDQIKPADGSGLSVKLSPDQFYQYMQIMNLIKLPMEADAERRSMNMKEAMEWVITTPAYLDAPDQEVPGDKMGKGEILRYVADKYKKTAVAAFFERDENQLLLQHSRKKQQNLINKINQGR